jgi:phosphonoacetaldehyde hydrolase
MMPQSRHAKNAPLMEIALVVFDWAGTLVDFGCRAPLTAFLEAFEQAGLPIDEATARKPMGAHKRDHVREILLEPEVAERARRHLNREADESLVDQIYGLFARRLPELLPAHAEPIPGAVETLQWLRARGISVGSTTGYTRAMMDTLEPAARALGIATDALICADETPQGRPAPWACFRLAERFGVYPMSRCLKIGDTPADVAEGLNAGMQTLAVSETGNEVGLSKAELLALNQVERAHRIDAAAKRLRTAGAHAVLRSAAELPSWIERGAS